MVRSPIKTGPGPPSLQQLATLLAIEGSNATALDLNGKFSDDLVCCTTVFLFIES